MEKDVTYTYKYPFIHTDDYVSTDAEDGNSLDNTILLGSSLSDEEMYVDGYSFLGWISSSEVEKDSDVWNYIYDDGDFTTSDVNKVKPYLLSDDEKVLEAIDVYPVYARYKINTKTNVQKVGNINVPFDPKYEIKDLGDGKGKVTFTIDMDSYIDENTKYNFDSFVLIDNDSEEVISASDNGYSYDVIAGKNYTFMAKYSNFVLLYHINDGETKIEIRDNGDFVGVMPNPTYEIENYLFAGWRNFSVFAPKGIWGNDRCISICKAVCQHNIDWNAVSHCNEWYEQFDSSRWKTKVFNGLHGCGSYYQYHS